MSTEATTYAEWLRAQMDERGLSQRQLATLLNPDNPEVARRSVRRYLKGMVPIERTRIHISRALGSGEDHGPDSESSEDDLLGGGANGAG